MSSQPAGQLDTQELKRQVGSSPFTQRIKFDGWGFAPCPFHAHDGDGGDETFHLTTTDDGAVIGTCFSLCGKNTSKGTKSWDAIAFVQKFDGVDRNEAIRRVVAAVGSGDGFTPRQKEPAVPMTAEVWESQGQLVTPEYAAILAGSRPHSDTPSAETLNAMGFKVTSTGYLVCAYRLGDRFYTVKGRSLSAKEFRQENAISQRGLFNIDAVIAGGDVYVVESELDAAVLHEHGYTAVSVISATQKSIEPEVLEKLLTAGRIFLVGDSDEAGILCMDSIAKLLPAEKVYRMPITDAKDIGEWTLAIKQEESFVGSFKENWEQIQTDAIGDREVKDKKMKTTTQTRPANAPTQPVPAPIIRIAADIIRKRVEWLWKDRVPLGMIALFAGNPDNGKSLASTWLAATCTTQADFPDVPNTVPASEVLMLLGEDEIENTATPRLEAAGADMRRVHFLEGVKTPAGDQDVRLDWNMPTLEKYLQHHPNIRLVIIDPISMYLGSANMMGDQESRSAVLTPLKRLAAKYNVAVVIVMHLNKKSELDAISRVGGAMAFVGVARAGWIFQRDKDDEGKPLDTFSMLPLRNNLTRFNIEGLSYKISAAEQTFADGTTDGIPHIVWLGTTTKTADEALGSGRPAHRPEGTDDKLQAAVHFLIDALKDGRRPSKVIVSDANDGFGIGKSTVHNAAKKLGVKNYKEGKVWYWEIQPIRAATGSEKESDTVVELDLGR